MYYSYWNRNKLVSKPGLKEFYRQRIEVLLRRLGVLTVTDAIAERYWLLWSKYESFGLRQADAILAGTAWQRKIPLLTRNQKHFRFIAEIELAPVYQLR